MEIKVNDYVRTKWGCIAKFEGIHEGFYDFDNIIMDESSSVNEEIFVDIVEKTSPNIGKLLKVGDFIDGLRIVGIEDTTIHVLGGWFIDVNDVEDLVTSIVTKEQFEQMEYKIN